MSRNSKITLQGEFQLSDFLPWIERYARKLGVQVTSSQVDGDRLELSVSGPDEMLEALALGCSLGPKDAYVHSFGISAA